MLEYEELTQTVIGAAIEVHRQLGPGLLEATYESCLCMELDDRGIPYERQVELPVFYKGRRADCGYRIDILVRRVVVLELKSVEKVPPIHEAILLHYLKLGQFPVGLLINFNVVKLVDGITRRANTLSPPRSPRPPR